MWPKEWYEQACQVPHQPHSGWEAQRSGRQPQRVAHEAQEIGGAGGIRALIFEQVEDQTQLEPVEDGGCWSSCRDGRVQLPAPALGSSQSCLLRLRWAWAACNHRLSLRVNIHTRDHEGTLRAVERAAPGEGGA